MRPFHGLSQDGSLLPLLLKLQREGHPVSMSPRSAPAGKGLIPYRTEPPAGAVVLMEGTGQVPEATALRGRGFAVIGGCPQEKELELDRPAGARIMHEVGISTPLTYPFTTVAAAIKFLRGVSGGWFVKLSGSGAGTASTCDAPTPDEMIRYLEWAASKGPLPPFELQQQVEGVEVSCEGWFDGREFVPPFNITLEEKKALAGDLGVRTGCESCVVWMAQDDALADHTVGLMADYLTRARYVGPLDLNAKVQADGTPYGLEWSARFGYDALYAWMRHFEGNLGEQLSDFVDGRLDEWTPATDGELSAVLRCSVPPYPGENDKDLKAAAGLPLDPTLLTNPAVDPVDVAAGPTLGGRSGIVGVVAAVGSSLNYLRQDLLSRARGLSIINLQYRIDPLSRVNRDMAGLEKMGLLGCQGWTT